MMRRKIIVAVLIVVLVVASTACKRNEKNEKNRKSERKPSGYRKYMFETDSDGDTVYDRLLIEEFEDLVSESTLVSYGYDQKPYKINKKYYDDSGEYLLKQVNWSSYLPTESWEYDWKGRVTLYAQKNEVSGEGASSNCLSVPNAFTDFQKKDGIKIKFYNGYNSINTGEMRTEFTYKGDSDRIATMKSVTGDGTEVCSLELGEGDIILSAIFVGESSVSYEETYIPEDRRSEWTYQTEEYSFDSNGEYTQLVYYSGEREYDDRGRCTFSREYNGVGEERELYRETSYTYDGDEAVEVVSYYSGSVVCDRETTWYNQDDKPLRQQTEYVTMDGQWYVARMCTYTYHPNGKTASMVVEDGDSNMAMRKVSEEQYDENGDETVERRYAQGELYYESSVSYIEVPGISGTVRYTVEEYYDTENNSKQGWEQYALCMLHGTEEQWVSYCMKSYDDSTVPYDVSDYGVFDEDGHLLKVTDGGGSYMTYAEYDKQGRLCLTKSTWEGEGEWGYIYEYWEGEKPVSE